MTVWLVWDLGAEFLESICETEAGARREAHRIRKSYGFDPRCEVGIEEREVQAG